MAWIINTCHTEWSFMIRMTEKTAALLSFPHRQRKPEGNKMNLWPRQQPSCLLSSGESSLFRYPQFSFNPYFTNKESYNLVLSHKIWSATLLKETLKLYLKQPLVKKIFIPGHNLKIWNSHAFKKLMCICSLFWLWFTSKIYTPSKISLQIVLNDP